MRHEFARGARLCIAVVFAMSHAGCLSRPKLDADRAGLCVSETFAFAELRRGVKAPLEVHVESEDEDFIVIGVFESAPGVPRRLGTFRVSRDRNIWRQDLVTADWRLIGICD